ncbi:MAG: type III toxin-antitoxin system ToxN/AbiQ family toxin, partial [Longicatena sp.]
MLDLTNYEIQVRDNLHFFYVNDRYVRELQKIDPNICDNKGNRRAHIGILFEIQGILYLAPLTSTGKTYLENNKKHKRIVYPLENGELGYIRIGNIIPVPRSELTPIIISEINDDLYKNLLLDQYNFLSKQGVSE